MLTLLTTIAIIAAVSKAMSLPSHNQDDNHDFLSRIGDKYELVDLHYDSDSQKLSFIGFETRYEVQLTLNEKMVGSKVKHYIDGKPVGKDKFSFGSLKESCHYHIRPQFNDDKFRGAVSMCPTFGLQGRIRILGGGDTLVIMPNPFKYSNSENAYDHEESYDLSDKHLIYFKSDFDISGTKLGTVKTRHNLGNGEKIIKTHKRRHNYNDAIIKNGLANAKLSTLKIAKSDGSNINGVNGALRRRMSYNNGNNEAEICVLFDPYIYEKYKNRYLSNYDDKMEYAAAGMISTSSETFLDTNWGSDIGDIQLKLISVNVITSFSGIYNSLEPDWINGDISSDDYLDRLSNWAKNNADWNSCDNIKLYTVEELDAGGIANVAGMCKTDTGESATMTVDYYPYGYTDMEWSTDTTEHELGHNFGAWHDQDFDSYDVNGWDCNTDSGIMGYGDSQDDFSYCTIAWVQDYFSHDGDWCGGCSCCWDIWGTCYCSSGCPNNCACLATDGGDNDSDSDDDDCDNCFKCDDGCQISSGYQNDGWCDCTNCEDEDNWKCSSCGGCPSSCGDYKNCYGRYANEDLDDLIMNDKLKDGVGVGVGVDFTEPADTDTEDRDGGTIGMAKEEDTSDCTYANCVSIMNMDTVMDVYMYDFNVEWTYEGCYNSEGYYTADIEEVTMYLYKYSYSNGMSYWNIGKSLTNPTDALAICAASLTNNNGDEENKNVLDCSGKWFIKSGYLWKRDIDTVVIECDTSLKSTSLARTDSGGNIYYDSSSEYCINPYGDSLCLYASGAGSLWNDIAVFSYNGCKNDVAYFYFSDISSDSSISSTVYYLHFESTESNGDRWIISMNSISDVNGIAFCGETMLTDCTYESWQVKTLSGNGNGTDVEISYPLDKSMGYDASCDGDSTTTETDLDLLKCDIDSDESVCAVWQVEMDIMDKSYSVDNMCDDDFIACITQVLHTDISQVVEGQFICHSNYDTSISMNVSFATSYGYTIYSAFVNNYTSVVRECAVDGTNLDISIQSDKLVNCQDCQSWSQTTNDESGANIVKFACLMVVAVITHMFLVVQL